MIFMVVNRVGRPTVNTSLVMSSKLYSPTDSTQNKRSCERYFFYEYFVINNTDTDYGNANKDAFTPLNNHFP